jgi:hypothetical protein
MPPRIAGRTAGNDPRSTPVPGYAAIPAAYSQSPTVCSNRA